jgi:eukaryotic-like serine/threonine-protein kinase
MGDSSCAQQPTPDPSSSESREPVPPPKSDSLFLPTVPPVPAARQNSTIDAPPPQGATRASEGADSISPLFPTRTIDSRPPGLFEEPRPFYKLGDYELLGQIAKGGMGIVYKARQVSLNRIVAFKTIRDGRLSTDAQIARFRNEAHAAAALHHSNIVPVYEFGEIEGVHFISMEFVDGESLAERIKKGPLDPVVAAGYLEEIAKTMGYAHSRGFLHRDLKPSNILVDSAGRPRVTDFGLVKPIHSRSELTGEGAIVGTPSYMAPEQSLSNTNTSPASDVYSLGAILYALLTGVPPFSAENDVDTLIQVRTKDPIRPKAINGKVPSDLELVCLKCLAKEPDRRYATADLLAEDLMCFLAGAPVGARSMRLWERVWLWSRRHPLQAASVLLVFALLSAWIGTLIAANVRLDRLNDSLAAANRQLVQMGVEKDAAAAQAHELQLAAEAQRAKADELLYISDMQQAGTALRAGDMRRLAALLGRHHPQARRESYQGGEWDFLWRRAKAASRSICRANGPVYFVALSPDERHLVTAGKEAVVRVYNLASTKLLFSIDTHQVEVNGLAFSPDGQTLASAGDDGTIALWQMNWREAKASKLRVIKAHPFQVFNVLYSSDGRTLISAGRDTVIRLWNPTTGESQGVLKGHRDTAGSIAVHPAGKWIASAGHDSEILIWDLETRSIVRRVEVTGQPVLSIDFSTDGRLFAAGTSARDIRIWRLPGWEPVKRIELLDDAHCVTFLPDARTLVACDSAGTIRKFPAEAGAAGPATAGLPSASLQAWKAHSDEVFKMTICRRTQELITAGRDGCVEAWSLEHGESSKVLRNLKADVEDFQFVSGTNRLALTDGHAISLWDPESLSQTRVLGRTDTSIRCLAVSRDGSTLAAGGLGGVVRLYDLNDDGRESEWSVGPTFNVYRIALSPDGRLAAAIDRYNSEKRDDLYVLNTRTGERLERIRLAACNSACFSPDGRWLLASGPSNAVVVWNVQTQEKVSERPGHQSSINCIQFAPFAPWAATAGDDRLIKIWSTVDWQFQFNLEGARRPICGLAVSADGRTLASCGQEGVLTFWHTAEHEDRFQPMIDIDFSPAHPERISFSSDGRLAACLVDDRNSTSVKRSVHVFAWKTDSNRSGLD